VNLQEAPIRDPKYSPGAGGWPTVRYFNRETGYDGAAYTKKTSKSMCDELGDMEYMRGFVNEKSIPPCQVDPPHEHCEEKEITYVGKWQEKAAEDIEGEKDRLKKLLASQANPDLVKWLHQRSNILRQLLGKKTSEEAPAVAPKEEL